MSRIWFLVSSIMPRAVLRGLMFQRSGFYVNTARIDPRALTVDHSRMLKTADSRQLAVGVMLGLATECFIINEFNGGSASSPYSIRKISIAPFAQEMRRDTSVWGSTFGFHVIPGPVSTAGITFSSRRKADPAQSLSPSKSAGFLLSVTSTLSSPSSSRSGSYSFSRGFDEHSMCFLFFVLAF